ncbi:MAG: transcriptional repressor [Spirochaetota bacterium]
MRGRGRGPWWHNKFQEYGWRITPGREIIMDVLHNTKEHINVADIYIKAHAINPAIGLTTVYRTLEMLEKTGLVQKFDFGDGMARYELINNPGAKDHHHHLICMTCKRIIDYTEFINDEVDFIEKTQGKLSKKYNFKITGHMINFYGLCEQCSKTTA